MLSFTSPDLLEERLEFAIARKPMNQYLLIFGRAYGMAASREVDILNYSTPRAEKIELSEDGHPLIWLDTDLDRRNKNYLTPVGGMLAGLKSVEPPVIRPTGRTRKMHAATGGEREAAEVELLLSEEDLGRICYYCRAIETTSDARYEKCAGEGHESVYCCYSVGLPNYLAA